MPRPRKTARPHIVRLRILLAGVDPLVWRTAEVPAEYSLHDLHHVIQASMGWLDYHLHQFRVDGQSYGDPEIDEDGLFGTPAQVRRRLKAGGVDTGTISELLGDRELLRDERVLAVEDVLRKHVVSFEYEYDFGDDWRHVIVIDDIDLGEPFVFYPRCLGGARACPPEDVGGPHGYAEMLKVLDDPEHPERAETLEWLGGGFDPERFDGDEVNEALRLGSGS